MLPATLVTVNLKTLYLNDLVTYNACYTRTLADGQLLHTNFLTEAQVTVKLGIKYTSLNRIRRRNTGYKRTLEKKHWLQTYMGVGTLFSGVFSRQKYISCYSRLFSQKNGDGLKA